MSLAAFPHPPRPNHSTSVMAFGRKQKRDEWEGREGREEEMPACQDTQLQDMDGSGRRVEEERRMAAAPSPSRQLRRG